MRLLTLALVASVIALGSGRLSAGEIKGKVKSIDADKGTIILTVGDADRALNVAGDAKVTGFFGKKLKKAVSQDVPGGLRGVKAGEEVTVTIDEKDGKVVATRVKLDDLQPKSKKKKKAKAA